MSIQTKTKPVTVQVCAVVTMEDGSVMEYVTEELDVTDADSRTHFELGIEADTRDEDDWLIRTSRVVPTGVHWLTCNARLKLADQNVGHLFTATATSA